MNYLGPSIEFPLFPPLNHCRLQIMHNTDDPNHLTYLRFCKQVLIECQWFQRDVAHDTPLDLKPIVFFFVDLGWNSEMLDLYEEMSRESKERINVCILGEAWESHIEIGKRSNSLENLVDDITEWNL